MQHGLEKDMERLRGGEIHVWLAYLDRPQEFDAAGARILAVGERERAARMRSARDGARFAASRAMLRLLLASYTGNDPRGISFRRSVSGRPILANDALQFSLSRSAGIALFAFSSDRDLGVDIELIDPSTVTEGAASVVFASVGRTAPTGMRLEERAGRFFRIWTRTEAYLKARGEGIAGLLGPFDAAAGSGAPAAAEPCSGSIDGDSWTLVSLPAPPGYAAALAYRGGRRPLRMRLVPPSAAFGPHIGENVRS